MGHRPLAAEGGEFQVGVGVDQPRQEAGAGEVADLLAGLGEGGEVAPRPHRRDLSVDDPHPRVRHRMARFGPQGVGGEDHGGAFVRGECDGLAQRRRDAESTTEPAVRLCAFAPSR